MKPFAIVAGGFFVASRPMPLSLDFAFEGFRILKARPKLIAFWGVVALVGNGLGHLLLIALSGPALERGGQILAAPSVELAPDLAQAVLLHLLPGLLVSQGIGVVTSAIVAAAVCRAVAGDNEDGLGLLNFGARELQLILVMTVNAVLTLGLPLLILVATVLSGDTVALGFFVVAVVAAPWLAFRLSLNVPQSFEERRIILFDSFRLTRQGGWLLFGGYIVALILAMVVIFLCDQIIFGLHALIFGAVAPSGFVPDMTSLRAYLTPERILVVSLVFVLLSPQVMAITLAPPAAAYRRLRGLDTAGAETASS